MGFSRSLRAVRETHPGSVAGSRSYDPGMAHFLCEFLIAPLAVIGVVGWIVRTF
jgi:hypothetical protein